MLRQSDIGSLRGPCSPSHHTLARSAITEILACAIAVVACGNSQAAFEYLRKPGAAAHSAAPSDFIDGQGCCDQQPASNVETGAQQILRRGHAGLGLEMTKKCT